MEEKRENRGENEKVILLTPSERFLVVGKSRKRLKGTTGEKSSPSQGGEGVLRGKEKGKPQKKKEIGRVLWNLASFFREAVILSGEGEKKRNENYFNGRGSGRTLGEKIKKRKNRMGKSWER